MVLGDLIFRSLWGSGYSQAREQVVHLLAHLITIIITIIINIIITMIVITIIIPIIIITIILPQRSATSTRSLGGFLRPRGPGSAMARRGCDVGQFLPRSVGAGG